MGRPKTKPWTDEQIRKCFPTLVDLSDSQLAKMLGCDQAGIDDLKARGVRRNANGTWDVFMVYAWLCRLCGSMAKTKRHRRKPSRFSA